MKRKDIQIKSKKGRKKTVKKERNIAKHGDANLLKTKKNCKKESWMRERGGEGGERAERGERGGERYRLKERQTWQ